MDYYDDNPLKVNSRKILLSHIKQLRKTERTARKALRAQRKAEKLIEQEKQRELNLKFQEIDEKEKLKKCEAFEIRDSFDWDAFDDDDSDAD